MSCRFKNAMFQISGIEILLLQSLLLVCEGFTNILYDKTSEGEAEDSGDVGKGAVDLCFQGTPFMVQEIWVTWTIFCFGAHTLLCTTGSIMAFVLQ